MQDFSNIDDQLTGTIAFKTAATGQDNDAHNKALLNYLKEQYNISQSFLFLNIKPDDNASQYSARYQEAFEDLGIAADGKITAEGREFFDYVEKTASPFDKKLKESAKNPVSSSRQAQYSSFDCD